RSICSQSRRVKRGRESARLFQPFFAQAASSRLANSSQLSQLRARSNSQRNRVPSRGVSQISLFLPAERASQDLHRRVSPQPARSNRFEAEHRETTRLPFVLLGQQQRQEAPR